VQRTRKPAPQLTKTPRAQLTETPRPCAQGDKAVHAPQHALDDYLSRGMGGNDMVMGAQCAAPAPVVPVFFLLLLSARGHLRPWPRPPEPCSRANSPYAHSPGSLVRTCRTRRTIAFWDFPKPLICGECPVCAADLCSAAPPPIYGGGCAVLAEGTLHHSCQRPCCGRRRQHRARQLLGPRDLLFQGAGTRLIDCAGAVSPVACLS
jgi:hypothetical protein